MGQLRANLDPLSLPKLHLESFGLWALYEPKLGAKMSQLGASSGHLGPTWSQLGPILSLGPLA